MISEDSAILMHKMWPNPKFPNCVCDWDSVQLQGWEVPASPWPHRAAVLWWGFHGDQGWGWQEKDFVSGGSGIAFLRVSARWEAPSCGFSLLGAEQSSRVGAGLVSSAASSQSWRKWWEGMSCIQTCPPKILSGDHTCTRSLWSVSWAACGWGASVQGVWDSWGVVTIEQTRVLVKNSHGNVHFALP